MDIAAEFSNHSKIIGYTGNVSDLEISQVSQGVMKPILQFLLYHTKSKPDSILIKSNLALNSVGPINNPQSKINQQVNDLFKKAAENHLKISRLKSQISLKVASRHIFEAFTKKSEKFKREIAECREKLNKNESKSQEINSESLQDLSKRLLYLANQSKTFNFPIEALQGLCFNTQFQAILVLPALALELESLKSQVLEKIEKFSPEEEFIKFGINLQQKGEKFEIKHLNQDILFENFRKDVTAKRKILWEEYQITENCLSEISELKSKFKKLFENKKFLSKTLKEYCLLEISKTSRKAEISALNQGLAELELKKAEKDNESLLYSHQKSMNFNDSLVSRITNELTQQSQINREMLKKRFQTDEFIKQHISVLRSTLPGAIKPLSALIAKEVRVFSEVSGFLIPLNVPNFRYQEEKMAQLFEENVSNSKYASLRNKINFSLFQSTAGLYDHCKAITKNLSETVSFPELPSIPVKKNTDSSKKQAENNEFVELHNKIKEIDREINALDDEYSIWECQPAQHVIPWRKDHKDLNISEALELWKTSVCKKHK